MFTTCEDTQVSGPGVGGLFAAGGYSLVGLGNWRLATGKLLCGLIWIAGGLVGGSEGLEGLVDWVRDSEPIAEQSYVR